MPPTYRLHQDEVDRGDFVPLGEAVARGERVDASELTIPTDRFIALEALLPRSPRGGAAFSGWLFTKTRFGDCVSFSHCDFRAVRFDDAIFGDECTFEGACFASARFDRASFGGHANFFGADLGRKAHFHSAQFGCQARFSHARFRATQFFGASFDDGASFRDTTFAVRAKFARCRFGERCHFTEATFPAGADFSGASFGEKMQMINLRFDGEVSFVGASFGARARLTNWRVNQTLNMRSVRFLGAMSLHGADIGRDAIFRYSSFDGAADLGGVRVGRSASFTGARFSSADRIGPIFVRRTLLLSEVLIEKACVLEVDARVLAMPRARLLGPVRLAASRAEVLLNEVEVATRLVLTSAPGRGKAEAPRLVSAEDMDVGRLVTSGVDIRALRLRNADNIDKLRIESGARFEPVPAGPRVRREAIAEEHLWRQSRGADDWYPAPCRPQVRFPKRVPDRIELARIYRGLRKAREDAKDAPGASDLYYAEMEMRRLEARHSLRKLKEVAAWLNRAGELVLLELYRFGGGYGVRPSRPILLFLILALAGAVVADHCDAVAHTQTQQSTGGGSSIAEVEPASFGRILAFVIRSALLLPAPSNLVLTLDGEVIQICCRIIGPLLIGLFAVGLRARVRR